MSLELIDTAIAKEVGELCWHMLPKIDADAHYHVRDEMLRVLWEPETDVEIIRLLRLDPIVDCPAIILDPARGLGRFVFPPQLGEALKLSEYLTALRQFLMFQMTADKLLVSEHIWSVLRSLGGRTDKIQVLHFMDRLWRGRWIIDSYMWARLRAEVAAGNSIQGVSSSESDQERLASEATRLILAERSLKETCRSLDEWLHEIYCLLPEITASLFAIRNASERHCSDELDKFDRILDEFLADAHTTFGVVSEGISGEHGLMRCYLLNSLETHSTVGDAIDHIRGIYRGRTIVPKAWYEAAKHILLDVVDQDASRPASDALSALDSERLSALERVDHKANFGRGVTADELPGLFLAGFLSQFDAV